MFIIASRGHFSIDSTPGKAFPPRGFHSGCVPSRFRAQRAAIPQPSPAGWVTGNPKSPRPNGERWVFPGVSCSPGCCGSRSRVPALATDRESATRSDAGGQNARGIICGSFAILCAAGHRPAFRGVRPRKAFVAPRNHEPRFVGSGALISISGSQPASWHWMAR